MNRFKIVVITLLFSSTILLAHGDKKHKKEHDEKVKPDTILIIGADTISINGKPYRAVTHDEDEEHLNSEKELSHEEEHEEEEEISLALVFEHLHNKLVHFPVALGYLLFFFMIVGYKQEVCYRASKIIVSLGVIFTIAAIFTGINQATAFEDKEIYDLVVVHRTIGFILLANYLVMAWAVFTRRSNKLQLVISLILALIISAAGFYGGIIAH